MSSTLRLDAENPQDIARAAEILRSGGTVAFPTETVYGLGANALSPEAVARIFTAKQRPSWDPLIVHVPDYPAALALVEMPPDLHQRVDALASAFWPGPLTLLLPRRDHIPDIVTAGRPLVGIRIPSHPAAQALLRAVALPLAAPSANRFGHTSPTTAQHVLDDLDGRIDAVLDGGPTPIGLESTVLDPTTVPGTLFRPGGVSPEQVESVTGLKIVLFRDDLQQRSGHHAEEQISLPAPGVGLRHYAPLAKLILVEGTEDALSAALANANPSVKNGVLLPSDWTISREAVLVENWSSWKDVDRLGSTLFAGLRELDARGAEVIFCPMPIPGGLRDAILDRLRKAAREA